MVNMIMCLDACNGLGRDNDLLYRLPSDMKMFRQRTLGMIIIMGRKTFESLPKVLPHREHWVITNQEGYIVPDGVKVFHSKEEVLQELGDRRAFVIGGSSIYQMFLDDCTNMYVTRVNDTKKADTVFDFDESQFSHSQIGMGLKEKDEVSGRWVNYTFDMYTRKKLK